MKLSVGKILAIICGVLAVVGILFLMNSGGDSSAKTAAKTSDSALTQSADSTQDSSDSGSFASDEDLKKIKELEKSVRKAPENLSKLYLVRCAPCHFKDGKGDIAPSIAGKSKDEILAKLRSYKEGKEPNALMNGLMKNMKDSELQTLAEEISHFK